MATPLAGLLGKGAIPAAAYTVVYTVSAGTAVTGNIRLINRDPLNALTVRMAICPPGYAAPAIPADADWIIPLDMTIKAGGMSEDTAISASAGEQLVVFSSLATLTVRAHGFEK